MKRTLNSILILNKYQDSYPRCLLYVKALVSRACAITGRQCIQTANNSVTCDQTLLSLALGKKRDSGKEVSCSPHELRVNHKKQIRSTQNLAIANLLGLVWIQLERHRQLY